MAIDGEYVPSTAAWVRDQVEEYEASGGTAGITLRDTGLPVVIVTNRGAKTGVIRKTYADYQQRTDRLIPVFVLERAG